MLTLYLQPDGTAEFRTRKGGRPGRVIAEDVHPREAGEIARLFFPLSDGRRVILEALPSQRRARQAGEVFAGAEWATLVRRYTRYAAQARKGRPVAFDPDTAARFAVEAA